MPSTQGLELVWIDVASLQLDDLPGSDRLSFSEYQTRCIQLGRQAPIRQSKMTAIGRFLPLALRRALVKSNANCWSAGMQLTGQWLCKLVVKSLQFRSPHKQTPRPPSTDGRRNSCSRTQAQGLFHQANTPPCFQQGVPGLLKGTYETILTHKADRPGPNLNPTLQTR